MEHLCSHKQGGKERMFAEYNPKLQGNFEYEMLSVKDLYTGAIAPWLLCLAVPVSSAQ